MEKICSQNQCKMVYPPPMAHDLNVDQIKKLWVLDLIIQHGSLKQAALQAKVSPSAISQSLSSLEQSIGKPLLVRDKGAITPTQDALSILEVVRPAFEAFDRLRNIQQMPTPRMTWLNFGTYESIAIDILPGLIHSLKQKMPHLRLGLRVSRTDSLLTMIRKGELCAALIAEVDDLSRFCVREVGTDRLGFYISNTHSIAHLGWKAVDSFGIGSLAPGKNGLPRYFSKFMKQVHSVRPLILSDSFETLRSAAAAGSLVAILPHKVAMRARDLVEIHPPQEKRIQNQGLHKICIVSQKSCDPEETDFLAAETSRLLTR